MTETEVLDWIAQGHECMTDHLTTPLNCTRPSKHALQDSDGWFAACTECNNWWKEYNS